MQIDKRRIGRLLMAGYQGDGPSDDFLRFAEEWGMGGVIVFVRNLEHPERLPGHLRRLEGAAGRPMLSSIDQEGGLVLRLLVGASPFPGAMALAAVGDPAVARAIGEACAREMRAVGLNFNLAPVLDINHRDNPGIGARAFGDRPDRVIRYAIPYLEGLRAGGVLACAKHFPGKGHAMVDSHLSLPSIPYPADRLRAFELAPFAAAIKAGVESVMTSHVFFPAFEPEANLPATLSRAVLTDLLRGEMGFEGLLITDDLEMGAITERFGIADAAARAFAAGADILLICHRLEEQRRALEAIQHYVSTSAEGMARLEASEARWQRALDRLAAVREEATLPALVERHAPLVTDVCRRSILAWRGAERLPLPADGPGLVLVPRFDALVQVEECQTGQGLPDQLQRRWPATRVVPYDPKSDEAALDARFGPALAAARPGSPALLFSYNAHLLPGQAAALRKVARQVPGSVVAALRNPYDLTLFPEAAVALASFGFRSASLAALLAVLTGECRPGAGAWPVDLGGDPPTVPVA